MRIYGYPLSLTVALAAAALAGCGGQSATAPLPAANGGSAAMSAAQRLPVTTLTFDTTDTVGINLTGQMPTKTRHYGNVLGYFLGNTIMKSQVVTILSGSSVQFSNLDGSLPHSAAFLGDATKMHAPWPASFNGSTTQSQAGTDISSAKFATGSLNPHTTSPVYAANVPGFYMFGCQYHYNTHHMRTVIIVKT